MYVCMYVCMYVSMYVWILSPSKYSDSTEDTRVKIFLLLLS